jgi:hypothetical protein
MEAGNPQDLLLIELCNQSHFELDWISVVRITTIVEKHCEVAYIMSRSHFEQYMMFLHMNNEIKRQSSWTC